jgi:hypothetical protein
MSDGTRSSSGLRQVADQSRPGQATPSVVTIGTVKLEAELQALMDRVAATDIDLANRLASATRLDTDAEVDGVSKGALTTVDLLRIRGRLDGLREAVLRLAREIDARDVDRV